MKAVITDKELLLLIQTKPGITANEVADFYDVSRYTGSGRLNKLFVQQKIVRRNVQPAEIKGKQWGYWLSDAKDIPADTVQIKSKVPPKITNTGLEAQITQLKSIIAELEDWKSEALRRHPDLAVSPIVLQARRIVTKAHPGCHHKDDSPIMLAVIMALEENGD